jgi:hypothetical protein
MDANNFKRDLPPLFQSLCRRVLGAPCQRLKGMALIQINAVAYGSDPLASPRRQSSVRRSNRMKRRALLLSGCCLSLVGACQSSVDAEQTTTINAVVETVDPNSRELLLRGAGGAQSGRLLSMIVSPRVQRLDQIRPGDRVTVTYYQALAAQVVGVRSPASPPFEGVSVNRTETASRPGGEVTRVRSGRVTITDVDPATSTVSFIGPNNVVRTVTARNPQVQSFIRSLRVGQQVDILYEEALAISVEPMR